MVGDGAMVGFGSGINHPVSATLKKLKILMFVRSKTPRYDRGPSFICVF
jgi:hypothetical protein